MQRTAKNLKKKRTTDFSRISEYKVNIKINFMCFSYEQVETEIKNSEKAWYTQGKF